jgi:hypothetical protein
MININYIRLSDGGGFYCRSCFHSKGAGFPPGLVADLWTARPSFHHFRVILCDFLHPVLYIRL